MDNGQFYSALGVIWVFGFIAVILVAWHLRQKRRLERLQIVHEERMKAMEKGIPLPEFPDLDDTETRRRIGESLASSLAPRAWNPRWPLGAGVLLIMAGVGTSVAMRLSAWDLHQELWPFGLIGVFVGVGFFLFYGLTRGGATNG